MSKQKKRIQQDGFDLDLTYITEQIIAMGLPCTGVSGIYRNPQGEVIKFLTAYHEGQYKIYNLCARPQDQYDAEKFAGRVACYPFEDHEVPPLKMVDTLARDVEEWLKGSPDRVVCIHCLAGKGRTGLMVCAALMLQGIFKEGRDAMAYYGEKRMKNKKGVTQASQRRWVEYYEQLLASQRGGPSIELDLPRTLTQVRLVGYPDKDVSLQVLGPGHAELADTGVFRGQASCSIVLREDVCLQLSDDEGKPLAQLWLHAAFLDQPHLVCDRHWLDLERKNKKSKALKKATVEFLFADDGSFVSPGRCGKTWPPCDDGWYRVQKQEREAQGDDDSEDDDDDGEAAAAFRRDSMRAGLGPLDGGGPSAAGGAPAAAPAVPPLPQMDSARREELEEEMMAKQPTHLLPALMSMFSPRSRNK